MGAHPGQAERGMREPLKERNSLENQKVKEKFQGLKNIKIRGYTVIQDLKKKGKERTTETKFLSESLKSKKKNFRV